MMFNLLKFGLVGVVIAPMLIVLALAVSCAENPKTTLQAKVIPAPMHGRIRIVRGETIHDNTCETVHPFTLSTPVQPGHAIMGSLQWEAPPGCSGGSLDTVTLGSQRAIILQTINPSNFGQDFCCASVTYFILFNASGTQSNLTVSSSNGYPFSPIGIGVMAEVSGLPSTAMVDAYNGNFTNSARTGNDALRSGSITPSAAGDFLYGFQLSTYAAIGALNSGRGWTTGPNNSNNGLCGGCGSPYEDEYITTYNSIDPIAATFDLSSGGGEWWTGIIAIRMQ
jgi:hypothetical protein